VTFRLDERGRPAFDVAYRDKAAATGTLGLVFAGSGPMREDLKVVGTRRASRDETYSIPVGKASSARDRHHELIISLEEEAPPHRRLDLAFRAFDDGVAFRYSIPSQGPLAEFILTEELTRLAFPGDPTARALP
jgi:alpha-glucosidase